MLAAVQTAFPMIAAVLCLALFVILGLAVPTALEELNAKLDTTSGKAAELHERLTLETAPTPEQIKSWTEEMDGYAVEMKSLNSQIAEREKLDKIGIEAKANIERLKGIPSPMRHDGGGGARIPGLKSLGARFVDSEEFKSWRGRVAPSGALGAQGSGGRLPDSDPVKMDLGLKAIVVGTSTWDVPADTTGAAFVQPTFRGLVDEGIWQIPLGVADLVTHEPTDSDVIFYVKVHDGSVAALTVHEATASGDTSGTKPEGSMTFSQGTAIVRTLAIWIPITRQAVASSAQLRGVVERYLRYELMRELSRNIINGNGTGEEFTGIQNLPDVLTQTFSADIVQTARKSITNLLLNGRTMPNAWCMYPTDFEAYDLTQDAEQRYYFGGPRNGGVPTLWGVPVRQSEFVTQGTPILGDWTRYVVADREQATLRVSDSHDKFFIRNMLALLDELRAAGYCERDQAFCKVELS